MLPRCVRLPVFLRPLLFVIVPVVLLHPLWTHGTGDSGAREQPRSTPSRLERRKPEVPPDIVRQSVETAAAFMVSKMAACPKSLPDRHEEWERYPAIRILQDLRYLQSTAANMQRTFEMTPAGRLDLMADLKEEEERYVFTIARRAYDAGSEWQHADESAPTPADRIIVEFKWHWEPINNTGAHFSLEPKSSQGKQFYGRAFFTRSGTNWEMTELTLEPDRRNYMVAQ